MQGARGRVASVRPRPDGTFGVLLGTGRRETYWFSTDAPPAVGELVEVRGAAAKSQPLESRRGRGKLTLLEGGELVVLEERFSRRLVARPWVERARTASATPLLRYQLEGVAWLASRLALGRGAILADEQGLGKSRQALGALVAARRLPALIVCPSSVKHHWAREAAELGRGLVVTLVRGESARFKAGHLYVCNYDLLGPREAELGRLGCKAVVFDEATYVKEPEPDWTHRAAVATRVTRVVGPALLLTGTPVLNRPAELWRLLHLVDPGRWPSFGAFARRYCTVAAETPADDAVVTEHGEAAHVEELRALMAPYMLRRTQAQIMRYLPPKSRRTVLVDLDPEDRTEYEAAERDVVAWLKEQEKTEEARRAMRGKALAKLTHLRRLAALSKLRRAVPEYLERWFGRASPPALIIFGYHVEVLARVREICEALGVRYTGITGQDSDVQRQRAVDCFQTGDADAFIAPIRAAGMGLNLQRANQLLFLERVFTPALHWQAEDRAYRLGQTAAVTATYLDAVDTVDQHLGEVIDDKQKVIDRIVDGKTSAARSDVAETIDEVLRRLAERRERDDALGREMG